MSKPLPTLPGLLQAAACCGYREYTASCKYAACGCHSGPPADLSALLQINLRHLIMKGETYEQVIGELSHIPHAGFGFR